MPQPPDLSAVPQPPDTVPQKPSSLPVPQLPDAQLVQRIRELVAGPDREEHSDGATAGDGLRRVTPARSGWVPTAPAGASPPRVLVLPGFLRGSRVLADRRAVLALVTVVLVAGLVFAARVAVANHQGQPVEVGPNPSARASRPSLGSSAAPLVTGAATPAGASSAGGGGPPPPVHVHVVGQVAQPGLLTLGPGSRVADAVTAAGGALPSADLQRVNLARLLTDGEQVQVPASGEPLVPAVSASTAAGSLVDLNTADLAALDSLPGVGPVLAQRIVDWRTAHGRFSTVEELGEVSGIGDKLLAQVRSKVTVGSGPGR